MISDLLEQLGQGWRADALCRGKTEIFFDEERWAEARQICIDCPVYRDCADYRDRNEKHLHGGIWAGLSMADDARSKRARNARRRAALKVVA